MNAFEKVTEFQDKLIASVPIEPEILKTDGMMVYLSASVKRIERSLQLVDCPHALQARLMAEELEEYMNAATIVDQADALIDLIYICMGGLSRMGLDGQKLFDVVHDANMTKLWEDGKPRFDEQGKLMKPPHFVRPEEALAAEIERQREEKRD